MKKKTLIMKITTLLAVAAVCLTGCAAEFSAESEINVITREAGSGTRGAFVELFGIEQKDANGNKTDRTVASALTNDKTGIVLTTCSQDINAIGYISLGSLNDSVKALEIDGTAPSAAAVKDGSYKAARPFNIAVSADAPAATRDFVAYILSAEGQAVIEAAGYIPVNESAPSASPVKTPGKIRISGSSSVTPVMEKLAEAYRAVNPNAETEINMTDSTSGMAAVASGASDIGMASRDIKQSELEKGIEGTVIALDGIAVIVNNANPLTGLSSDDVRDIYTGEATRWEQLTGAERDE